MELVEPVGSSMPVDVEVGLVPRLEVPTLDLGPPAAVAASTLMTTGKLAAA
jgi:hypothetical protein